MLIITYHHIFFSDNCLYTTGRRCVNGACLDSQCYCNDGWGGKGCSMPDDNECRYRLGFVGWIGLVGWRINSMVDLLVRLEFFFRFFYFFWLVFVYRWHVVNMWKEYLILFLFLRPHSNTWFTLENESNWSFGCFFFWVLQCQFYIYRPKSWLGVPMRPGSWSRKWHYVCLLNC